MLQTNHEPPRRLGANLVSFFTNGDSFEELLRQANCTTNTDIPTFMRGYPTYPFESGYALLALEKEMKMREIITTSRIDYAVTRELLNLVALFPELVRPFDRVPAFGRDICSAIHGNIPTVRKHGDGFELYFEHELATVWTERDAPLRREHLVA